MPGTTYATAPPGTVCCFLCHRYLDPAKIESGRCADRDGCQRATARMLGRVRPLSKRARKALGMD